MSKGELGTKPLAPGQKAPAAVDIGAATLEYRGTYSLSS